MQGSVVQPDTSTDEIFPETEPENVYTYNVNYSCVVFGDRLNIYSVYNEKFKKKTPQFVYSSAPWTISVFFRIK